MHTAALTLWYYAYCGADNVVLTLWYYAYCSTDGLCFFSSVDSDVPGSCDVFYSDEETGSQTAHLAGPDGTKGWRTAWRTEPEPETGEPQVHTDRTELFLTI